jgi:hypothetical protein
MNDCVLDMLLDNVIFYGAIAVIVAIATGML